LIFKKLLSFQEKTRQSDKNYSQHFPSNKNAPIKKNYPMEIYNFPPLTSSTFRWQIMKIDIENGNNKKSNKLIKCRENCAQVNN
jgi:hypothetical protein